MVHKVSAIITTDNNEAASGLPFLYPLSLDVETPEATTSRAMSPGFADLGENGIGLSLPGTGMGHMGRFQIQ